MRKTPKCHALYPFDERISRSSDQLWDALHLPQRQRIAAKDPDRQTAEIQVRVALINRFSARGTAEIVYFA